VPLVVEAQNWEEGVYMGATLGSETTAAITGKVGVVRRDPMAMLAFCGYHMGDYFAHWLKMGKSVSRPPKIFRVNWFRKDAAGKFIWPGFAENMRVLKWIVDRCRGSAHAVQTALGWQPEYADLDWRGLDFGVDRFGRVMGIEREMLQRELAAHDELFAEIGAKTPAALASLRKNLGGKIAP
jgi:phosphoenolpyruvate carboxykinase (GTP)